MRKNDKSLDTKICTYQGAQISARGNKELCSRSTAMRVLRRLQYKSTAFQLKYSKDLRNYVARRFSLLRCCG